MTAGAAPVVGYSLVLPEGWVRVPLGDEAEAARTVAALADRAAGGPDLPPDERPRIRAQVRGRLTAAVREARARGGIDLHLPAAPLGGLLLPVSMVVAELSREDLGEVDDGPPDPVGVLAVLLSKTEGAQAVELDGAPGLRREGRPVAPEGEPASAATVVEHLLAVPGAPGRWLSVSASVLAVDDDEVQALLLDLVDAVVSTFRWTVAPG